MCVILSLRFPFIRGLELSGWLRRHTGILQSGQATLESPGLCGQLTKFTCYDAIVRLLSLLGLEFGT